MSVEIKLNKSIYESDEKPSNMKLSGEMVFASDSAIYLNTDNGITILPWRNVVWLQSTDTESDDFRHVLEGILNILDMFPGISDEQIEQIRRRLMGDKVDPIP